MTFHSRIVFIVGSLLSIVACTVTALDTPATTNMTAPTLEVVQITSTPVEQSATALPPSATSAIVDTPASTLEPTAQPLATLPPSTSTRFAPASTATPGISIDYFEIVSDEPLHPGRRITMRWSAHGASAQIIAGTRQRFMEWWVVPLSGEMTVELTNTLFRNPSIGLSVSDGIDTANQVNAVIPLEWACDYKYFFEPEPQRCPRDAAITILAAEQRFEGGRMLWLENEDVILVLYDADKLMRGFTDTWETGQPESDPQLTPPQGRYQPIRGFGKVWRENAEVRDRLGWALELERGFETSWQFEATESIGSTSYLRTINGTLLRIYGFYLGSGSWENVQS